MCKSLQMNYFFTTEAQRTVRRTGRVFLAFPCLTIRLKTNTKQVRTVREYEIGRVFFWMGFSCDSDIHISLGIGLNCFLFSQLI